MTLDRLHLVSCLLHLVTKDGNTMNQIFQRNGLQLDGEVILGALVVRRDLDLRGLRSGLVRSGIRGRSNLTGISLRRLSSRTVAGVRVPGLASRRSAAARIRFSKVTLQEVVNLLHVVVVTDFGALDLSGERLAAILEHDQEHQKAANLPLVQQLHHMLDENQSLPLPRLGRLEDVCLRGAHQDLANSAILVRPGLVAGLIVLAQAGKAAADIDSAAIGRVGGRTEKALVVHGASGQG